MAGIPHIQAVIRIVKAMVGCLHLLRDFFAEVDIHKVHSALAVEYISQLLRIGRSELASAFQRDASGYHVAKELVPESESFDKLCSDHICSSFLISE